ncbi:MAG: hypothetical protein OEZ32_04335 [Nitrospinota bacterium]|nr:hypothetical protein [Nitrospinota bacterium]
MAEITIRDRKITVKELTVGHIREWYKELDSRASSGDFDVVNETFFLDSNLDDLVIMTDLTCCLMGKGNRSGR